MFREKACVENTVCCSKKRESRFPDSKSLKKAVALWWDMSAVIKFIPGESQHSVSLFHFPLISLSATFSSRSFRFCPSLDAQMSHHGKQHFENTQMSLSYVILTCGNEMCSSVMKQVDSKSRAQYFMMCL